MSRDVRERISNFMGYHIITDYAKTQPRGTKEPEEDFIERIREAVGDEFMELHRIALTMDQIREYNPPPNPAKITDSRANGYIAEYGDESWELDALEPAVLTQLIQDTVAELRDDDLWNEALEAEGYAQEQLTTVAEKWDELLEDDNV
jgi:hypothetical protein